MNSTFETNGTITLGGVSHDDLCDIFDALEQLKRPDSNQRMLLEIFRDLQLVSKQIHKGVMLVEKKEEN